MTRARFIEGKAGGRGMARRCGTLGHSIGELAHTSSTAGYGSRHEREGGGVKTHNGIHLRSIPFHKLSYIEHLTNI